MLIVFIVAFFDPVRWVLAVGGWFLFKNRVMILAVPITAEVIYSAALGVDRTKLMPVTFVASMIQAALVWSGQRERPKP